MQLPRKIEFGIDFDDRRLSYAKSLNINSGFTVILGPNGSGKTQVLQGIRRVLQREFKFNELRYLSANRLAYVEQYRSNFDGQRPSSDERINFGGVEYSRNDGLRYKAETLLTEMHTLKLRPDLQIKVSERLRVFFGRSINVTWDKGLLKVFFRKAGHEYSAATEARGLFEVVGLLTAIYNDETKVLIIDEPEVSLHPQLQSFILREMQNVAGDPNIPGKKLVIISTHSPEMIEVRRPTDLSNLVFCTGIENALRQIPSDADELKSMKLNQLLARLGNAAKVAMFSNKPLLVEGTSDEIICTGLERSLGFNLSAAGSQILAINGKEEFASFVKLMRMMGKLPVILTDCDTITDETAIEFLNLYKDHPDMNEEANRMGHDDLIAYAKKVRHRFFEWLHDHWDDISEKAIKHPYWRENGDIKKKQRRAGLATILNLSENEFTSLSNASEWKKLSSQFIALLDMLERYGCFVLRKGTIECYYHFQNTDKVILQKPMAAIQEVDGFMSKGKDFINGSYSDIVRAIEFASTVQPIDERKSIFSALVMLASSGLEHLSLGLTVEELNSRVLEPIQDLYRIFELDIEYIDETPHLVINLTSTVLNIPYFPLKLAQGSHAGSEIRRLLQYKE